MPQEQNIRLSHVYGNVMTLAIPLHRRIRTLENGEEHDTVEDFTPNPEYPVFVIIQKNKYATRKIYRAEMDGNVAVIHDERCFLPVGLYCVEVRCIDENEHRLRYMVRDALEIVDATADAGIQPGIEFDSEDYVLEGVTFFYAKGEDAKVNGYNTVTIVGSAIRQEGSTLYLETYSRDEIDDIVGHLLPTLEIPPQAEIWSEYDNLYDDNDPIDFSND